MLIPITDGDYPQHYGIESALTYIWDVPTLSWVKNTGSGGGGGGAVTVADGADVAEGTTTDVAWVSGAGTVIALLKAIAGGGGGAVTIINGGDVAEGATTDAAVVTDTTGTVSGKLRGLVKWAFERMPASLGQKTMSASFPVAIASNQGAVTVQGTVQPGNTQNTTPWLVSTSKDMTPSPPAAVSVGVTSAEVVASNATRRGLALVNVSNARISFGFGGEAAVLDSGVTLYSGGSFQMDEYFFDTAAVFAIASAAASPLAIQELST